MYKASNPLANTQAFVMDLQTDLDAYFIDRRYRQQYLQRLNPTYNSCRNFCIYIPRGRQPGQKCFVCNKEDCWSNRHT
jgi:hypothetical protein